MKKANHSIGKMSALPVLLVVVILLVPLFTVTAQAETYDETGATKFVFSESGITVTKGSYTGYKVEGTALTINSAGTYILSGSSSSGSVTVKKGTTGVKLVLAGLTLQSKDSAPLCFNKSTEVSLVVKAGTTNALADTAKNNDETYPTNENAENAVIKCKDGSKVTILGTGTLIITSNGKNGIKSGATTEEEGAASLTIQEVTLKITASANDAINAEQELNILSGSISITAADDAVHSDLTLNIGAKNTTGPTLTITKCAEGLEATVVNIYSGKITINATDDGINAVKADTATTGASVNIYGGTIDITMGSGDTDAIDTNGDLNIYGGTLNITAQFAFDYVNKATLSEDADVTVNGQKVTTITNSMMGGMGGRNGMMPNQGNFPGRNGTMPDQGEFPGWNGTAPDQGEFPGQNGTMPDQGEFPGRNGTMPDQGEFPGQNGTMPDQGEFPGQNGTAPDQGEFPGQNGTAPDRGEFPGQSGMMPGGKPEKDGDYTESAPDEYAPEDGFSGNAPEEMPAEEMPAEEMPAEENPFLAWLRGIWEAIVRFFTGKQSA